MHERGAGESYFSPLWKLFADKALAAFKVDIRESE